MEKNNISLALVGILLGVLLIVGFYSHTMVYAQSIAIVDGFNYQVRAISYQASTDSFWILSANQTGKVWLYQMDRDTGSVIFSFNHTQNWLDNFFAVPNDIWCGQTDCFITTASNTAGQVVRISTENIAPNIFAGQNVTGSIGNTVAAGFYQITGRDAVSGGFGSITLWVDTCSTSVATNCNGFVWVVDGISMLRTTTLGLYSGGQNANKLKMAWSGIAGIEDNHLAGANGGNVDVQAGSRIIIYDLSTLTVSCQTASPSTNSLLGIDTNYQSAGSANNKVYTGSINGLLYVWSDTCVLLQTITTGLSGDLRYVQYDSGVLFVQETGANAFLKSFAVNSTGHVLTTSSNTYQTFPSSTQISFIDSGQSIIVGDMILLAGNGALYFPYTGEGANDKKIGILQYAEGDDGGSGTGVNCDLPENENILICRLGGDGTLGSAGAFVIGNTTQGTGILGIGCSIGLVDCTTDDDPRTNGLGLLIFIASIFVIVGMFYKSLGANATFNIPVFLWVVIIIALSAFFTITEIIDPIFLVLSIIAVIALAVPKVTSMIQSRGFGGGGSTE